MCELHAILDDLLWFLCHPAFRKSVLALNLQRRFASMRLITEELNTLMKSSNVIFSAVFGFKIASWVCLHHLNFNFFRETDDISVMKKSEPITESYYQVLIDSRDASHIVSACCQWTPHVQWHCVFSVSELNNAVLPNVVDCHWHQIPKTWCHCILRFLAFDIKHQKCSINGRFACKLYLSHVLNKNSFFYYLDVGWQNHKI